VNNLNLLVSSLVLTAVLPISVAALYAMIARHVQLAPSSAMDSAATDRFDSETERAAFHADLQAAQQARTAAVLARYRHVMEDELSAIDPLRAEPYRQAIESVQRHGPRAAPETVGRDDQDSDSATQAAAGAASSPSAGQPPRRPRLALWRGRQNALRRDDSST
jgi:hypothetical protein